MQPLPNGKQINANDFFTNNTTEADRRQHGVTVEFTHRSGLLHTFMLVNDEVILGKAVTRTPCPTARCRRRLRPSRTCSPMS